MTDLERSIREASPCIETLHAKLRAAFPAFRGTLAIAGMFLGYGLEAFVRNGMTDDEIVEHTRAVVAGIRDAIRNVQPAS